MRVRTLLIVNPRATTTTKPVRDQIVRPRADRADIEVVETRHRGDAREIAARAVAEGWDALLVLSGDGTINEAVNGLMDKASIRAGRTTTDPVPAAGRLPALGALPGGNANVFTRDLGVPPDPLAAVELIAARLAAGTTRTIGLGLAGGRYSAFTAGLGWDAEVIHAGEEQRAQGRPASNRLYIRTALRQFRRADRRHPQPTRHNADRTRIRPGGPAP